MSSFIREINSRKWKNQATKFNLSTADMDIPLYEPFRNKFLQKIKSMNNLTYKQPSAEYYNTIKRWYGSRFIKDPIYGIRDEEILSCPSVFMMTTVVVSQFSEKGDGIMVLTPCYFQYYNIIRVLGRKPVEVELSAERNGLETRYYLDFQLMQQKAKQAKIFIFVNPNNLSGRVWSKQEISKITQICRNNNVVLVSDEILCDLIPANKLKDFQSLVNSDYDKVVVGNNIGKPFNISSVKGGYVIIRNKETRDKYRSFTKVLSIDLNQFATIFTQICYTQEGLNWLGLFQKRIGNNYQKLKIFAIGNNIFISKQEAAFLVVMGFQNYIPFILQEVEKKGICAKDDFEALPKFLAKCEIIGVSIQKTKDQKHICNIRFSIGVEESYLDKFLQHLSKILKKLLEKNSKYTPLL